MSNFPGVDFLTGTTLKFWKRKKIPCRLFTSSIKGEIRHFHAVVVQWRQRNVQKSVLHVQSCCFANQTKIFLHSRYVAVVVAQAPFKEASAKENWLPTKLCTTYERQEVRCPCCRLMDTKCKCKYHIIHSTQRFSGIIYNTGWRTLPDCLRCSLQVMKEWVMMTPYMSVKVR